MPIPRYLSPFLMGGAFAAGVLTTARALTRPVPDRLELTAMHRGGSGTPLLLLHGIGAIWRVWTPVLEFLEPHHDVIAPTLRGHGGGLPLDDTIAPSLDALADGVEEDLDRLGLGQVHIVGNSLGGWLAVELARRGRAQSLVLLSPAGAWNSQRRIAFTAKTIGLTVNLSSRCAPYADAVAANPALRWLMMAGQVAHPSRVSPESLAALIRASSQSPAVDPLLRRLPQRSMEPLPADRDYPTRVVWAVHDRVLPFDGFGVPMMARLPGADLVRLDGVGHVPMSDDPAGVARLILQVTGAVDAYPGRAVGGN
ncbi:alpha/beta fold hydrolase [Mycolicibacterium peregrinum]|uniref:alpha/beta fold hydrolase n=1 Tax=Mycolicibacterium TaxID=1866885 RepID=UPI0006D79708|nr:MULTISPECIES: alpha/beta fold hydrolase [Mycolicibacterium]MCV7205733.1 alpha/beta fold hydrolase [Mycolicibacterium peregrinum]ORW62628.1 alpha/beta hydrolase [Mycolicibacterium peregrinum]